MLSLPWFCLLVSQSPAGAAGAIQEGRAQGRLASGGDLRRGTPRPPPQERPLQNREQGAAAREGVHDHHSCKDGRGQDLSRDLQA